MSDEINNMINSDAIDETKNSAMEETLIILVEDDKFLRDMLFNKLEKENMGHIDTASNGTDAIKKIKEQVPKLVILDMVLPDMTGIDILEKIKQDAKTKDVKVLILTNSVGQDKIEKAKSLGALDYLIKVESSPEDIVNKIKILLAS